MSKSKVAILNGRVTVTTTLFNTQTHLGYATNGTVNQYGITLNDSVQAGDRLKVYLSGGSVYPSLQGGIIEFEVYSPTENSICGGGMLMNSSNEVAQHMIISAKINHSSSSSTAYLNICVYGLDSSAYGEASFVYVEKVERLRYTSGDPVSEALNGEY